MADQFSKNPEKSDEAFERPEAAEKAERLEKRDAKEIKETSEEFVEGVSEVVEGAEVAEFVPGEVSEETREGKKVAPSGAKAAGGAATVMAQSKVLPPIEDMQIQIAAQIKKEIRILEKEASKIMKSPGQFSPFKLNGIVAKIRELRDILANLAYAAAETVKGWWMKFVKGITI